MKQRFKEWLSDKKFQVIAFFFIWIVPLIMLVALACESKSKNTSFKLWGTVVGIVIVIIYFAKFKSWLGKKVEFEKHEQLRVPVSLRLVQLLVCGLSFTCLILILTTMKEMFDEVITFSVCCAISCLVGYLFLIIDSYKRKPKRIARVE